MTDLLELLLDQPEEEEEQTLRWNRPRTVPAAGGTDREPGRTAEHPVRAAERMRERQEGQNAQGRLQAEEGLGARELLQTAQRLSRSVQRAQWSGRTQETRTAGMRTGGVPTGAGTVWQTAGQAADQAGTGAGGMAGAAVQAAWLDAVFRRDARRYDGPLGLL